MQNNRKSKLIQQIYIHNLRYSRILKELCKCAIALELTIDELKIRRTRKNVEIIETAQSRNKIYNDAFKNTFKSD